MPATGRAESSRNPTLETPTRTTTATPATTTRSPSRDHAKHPSVTPERTARSAAAQKRTGRGGGGRDARVGTGRSLSTPRAHSTKYATFATSGLLLSKARGTPYVGSS